MIYDIHTDSCYMCDSVDITARYGPIMERQQLVKCICRDCGTEWEDFEDVED